MRARTVEFHAEAVEEARQARRWYQDRSAAAAERFARALEACIEGIRESPQRWPAYLGDMRQCFLRGFPFRLIYREVGRRIQVIAVAHMHRRPGYWMDRTGPGA